jgi:hypothetical protein
VTRSRGSQMWLALLAAAFGVGVAALLLWLGQAPPSPTPAGDPASAVRNASPQPPLTFAPQPTVTAAPTSAVQLTRRRVAVTPTG